MLFFIVFLQESSLNFKKIGELVVQPAAELENSHLLTKSQGDLENYRRPPNFFVDSLQRQI
jgi:hypothetical protein